MELELDSFQKNQKLVELELDIFPKRKVSVLQLAKKPLTLELSWKSD